MNMEVLMKKKWLILLVCLFTLTSANIFADTSVKFDVALRGNLGLMDSVFFADDESALRVIDYGLKLYLDTVFIAEDSRVYGGSIGIVLGFSQFDQHLKNGLYISEAGMTNGTVTISAQPVVPMHLISTGLMGRFYPVNNVSIGVGGVLNFVINKGSYMFTEDDDADVVGFSESYQDALMNPLFGVIIPEAVLELNVTRFFGNFGLDFGVNTGIMFYGGSSSYSEYSGSTGSTGLQMLFRAGASFGFRYRFSPY